MEAPSTTEQDQNAPNEEREEPVTANETERERAAISSTQPNLEVESTKAAEEELERRTVSPTIELARQSPPATIAGGEPEESTNNSSRVLASVSATTSDGPNSQLGVKNNLELFKALEKRWKEIYGDQTPQEIEERAHRILADPGIEGGLNTCSKLPSTRRPGLASLLEEVSNGSEVSRPSGAGGPSTAIVQK